MKIALFVLCLFCTTAVFAQSFAGGYRSSEPVIPQSPSHPAHASYAPMATGQSILSGAGFTSAQGDRPASDFPQPEAVSLGIVARELREQHAHVKKSTVVWVN
jgi:hypothetical protein